VDRTYRDSTQRRIQAPGYRNWICGAVFLSLLFVTSPGLGQENIPALVKKTGISIAVILNYDPQGKVISQGTGFFLNKEGDLVTNYHVFQGASRSEIRLSDGQVFPVKKIVAEDPEGDLMRVAIDIPGKMVHSLPLSPTLPEVGERILVIGNPLGLDQTVSDGIVSSIREIPGFGKMVQMTAPISPGSSGSPVLNMKGEVVGVATFLIVLGQNLNFAIPAERIAKMHAGRSRSLSDLKEKEEEEQLAQATELYATGLRFVWAQKYDMALPFFFEAVQRNPNHVQAYFQIGYCLATLGKYKEAIEPYQKALALTPKDPNILNNLCSAYGKSGRYGEAAQSCQKAIELKSDLAEAYNNLGWTYRQMGRHPEAIQSCKMAIRLQPDLAMAHYNLGNGYAALKRYEEAVESYKQAIRLEFDYAEAHLNLGAAYYALGRYEEAIDSYQRALLIKPSLPEGHLNLGMTYLRMGNRGSAIAAYKILKDLAPEMADRLFALIYE
jgi:tetratricopeptide (TPR) repeat protein